MTIGELVDTTDATGIAEALVAGDVTAVELVEHALARIDERNPDLNAVVAVRAEEALAEAAASVPGSAPFAGVPFVVKDLGQQVAGLPATKGSRLWADDIATEDSELVKRYRAAGFIPIGMTNTPELGKSPSTESLLHGPCHNPFDHSRSSGGSSGGTAASIAGGIVSIGHGSDGGGSIRIPAAACGLVGLKPSRGRTPAHPGHGLLFYPMGVHHVLTRSVRDTAHVLDLTAGPIPGDAYVIDRPAHSWLSALDREPSGLRIAFSTDTRSGEPVHPEYRAAVERTAATLEGLGHHVVEAGPDYPTERMANVMKTLMGPPTAVQIDARLAELGRELRDDDIEPFSRMMYDRAASVTGAEVLIAMADVERVAQQIGGFFVDHDLLLTPTVPEPFPELGLLDPTKIAEMAKNAGRWASLTSPFNTTGQPGISLPAGLDENGMPIGIQLVAAFGREDTLLSVGAQLERAAPWLGNAVY